MTQAPRTPEPVRVVCLDVYANFRKDGRLMPPLLHYIGVVVARVSFSGTFVLPLLDIKAVARLWTLRRPLHAISLSRVQEDEVAGRREIGTPGDG